MKRAALALVALAGCSGFIDRQAATSTLKILESAQLAARRLGDVELARDAAAAGIVQLEAFALTYPDEPKFAAMHADAVCDYALAFVFDDWEEAALAHRDGDAERAADRLRPLLHDCIALEEARLPRGWTPATLTPSDVPSALSIARARTALVALAPVTAIAQLPALRALLERCATLRPGYRGAIAEILLGTLAAGASTFTHGPDGEEWFAKAASHTGGSVLVTSVLHARAVSVARRDRAAFEAELTRIVRSDLAQWPENSLENALAVRKAKRYLADEAALFE